MGASFSILFWPGMGAGHPAHHFLDPAAFQMLDQASGNRLVLLIARDMPRLAGKLAYQRQAFPDGTCQFLLQPVGTNFDFILHPASRNASTAAARRQAATP